MTDTARRPAAPWAMPVVALAVVVVGTTAIAAIQGSESGLADLRIYREWALSGIDGGDWPVLDHPWVYPVGALPLVALMGFGPTIGSAFLLWLLAVFLVNAVAVSVLTRAGEKGREAAWWWVVFLAILGPAALMRLEAFTGALTVIAVFSLMSRPRTASVAFTMAGWIKVAPGVLMLPLVLIISRPLSRLVLPAAATSAAVAAVALAGGSGWRVFSFASEQSGRGLQIESVAASGWQIAHLAGGATAPHRNPQLEAYEFTGALADRVASAMDLGLLAGLVIVVGLVARARRRMGPDSLDLAALAMLATGLMLVVMNKVGSPQYLSWCAAGVVLGLLVSGARARSTAVPAVVLLVAALLTRLVFPIGYPALLEGSGWVVIVLVMRNLLVVALLGWTLWQLVRMGSRSGNVSNPPVASPRTRREHGVSALSYAILAGAIITMLLVALVVLGDHLLDAFSSI
jgi:hypothetical protein